ncbi:hypothetical protein MKW92_001738 [Papaver armeniacum]|nr:hypothetical protein MKW92_001738 [Papaver armeniacum]
MMPSQAKPMSTDEHNQNSSGGNSRKATTSSSMATLKPPEQVLKCPRCDSPNTKFCYYNNYSLTQPRHFCKTCRRYWTRGGALRNVPIGGGCRKNKKSTSSSTTKSSSIRGYSSDYSIHDSASSENGLKFFQHHAPSTMDFQLGGLSLSRLHHSSSTTGVYNQFAAAAAATPYGGDMGYHTFPGSSSNSSSVLTNGGGVQISQAEMASSLNVHSNLASSIESLSCINQDLHWKLQQQRLGMLFGTTTTSDQQMKETNDINESRQKQKPLQPIMFQNLEMTKADDHDQVTLAISKSSTAGSIVVGGNGNHNNNNNINTSSEWFFAENTNYPPTANNNSSNIQENGVQTWVGLNHHHQQQHHVQFTTDQ